MNDWCKVLTIAPKRDTDWPNLAAITNALLTFNADGCELQQETGWFLPQQTKLMYLWLSAASYNDYNTAYAHRLSSSKWSR